MSLTHCWFMLLYVYPIAVLDWCCCWWFLCNKFHYNVVNFSASQQSPCNSVKICEANICKVCCELRVWSARSFILTCLIFMQYIMCDIIIIIIMGISCIFILLITKLSLSACLEKPPVLKCIFTLPPPWSIYIVVVSWNILWYQPRWQSSWGQHGAHLGPVGPRWAPCQPHEPCYQGIHFVCYRFRFFNMCMKFCYY